MRLRRALAIRARSAVTGRSGRRSLAWELLPMLNIFPLSVQWRLPGAWAAASGPSWEGIRT